ncbi:MAG TPA: hypothetical protein VN253_14465 [Kofleriaceae bacterium]|nr:hypothetical protein [Kofleriaceae bacterium]
MTSTRFIRAAIAAALSLVPHASRAENWTAGDGPGPTGRGCRVDYDDGKASIAWRECEGRSADGIRSSFWDDCGAISRFLGDAKLSCRYDKPSFERHYAAVAKRSATLRSAAGDPANTAGMALKCWSDAGAAMGSVVEQFGTRRNGRIIAEIRSKVKTITVRYDEKTEPGAVLRGSELVLTVRTATERDSGIGSGCGWIAPGALAAFPELKKEFDDHR